MASNESTRSNRRSSVSHREGTGMNIAHELADVRRAMAALEERLSKLEQEEAHTIATQYPYTIFPSTTAKSPLTPLTHNSGVDIHD